MNNTQSPHACGAWIEGVAERTVYQAMYRRPTHVGRGLKFVYAPPTSVV